MVDSSVSRRFPIIHLKNRRTFTLFTTKILPIAHAGGMSANPQLKNARLRITLNHLRVARYPGSGIHHILLDFSARNQVQGSAEEALHFNMAFRGYEGEAVATIGYPIFIGLNVGPDGVYFGCKTVNVQNDDDQKFLEFLDSEVFKAGLRLVSTLQPAIAPLTGVAVGLTKSIAQRHQNVSVQEFFMGLDFSNDPTGARLAEGSYLAVQIPQSEQLIWDWDEWQFDRSSGLVVNKENPSQLIPYNYIIFGVTKYEGA
ncbi:MAG: hypothetical protein AUF64_06105 [Chloroflexi bacterium 13_1_20CM_54_36]|nr:MAG: hypothetical protein AUI01_02940 [Ktedonobacter sp. 13_2_20CM_2_56_8]OLD82731.1 MAG: hypothetical protein AUF64_06105 [Chloroflexi bacterium 13_1_20CM_54_36]OLE32787.1 MAG: hypothetical protein AUG45_09085 [Ktedonobacter sp. 13_1_20CM_3_54_15]